MRLTRASSSSGGIADASAYDVLVLNGGDPAFNAEIGQSVARWGGNASSRYNFKNHTYNTGSDWYFENIVAGPDNTVESFVRTNRARGAKQVVTVPMIGWVAKDSPAPTAYGSVDEAQAGDNAGILLRGTKKDEVQRGQVLAKPGSVTPHTKFNAQVYILSKDEGGRHTPFFNNYRPQFYFRTTDVTGSVVLPGGTEMVMPGDNTEMEVTLIQPIAMDEGLRFAIREGGRTVGAGRVTKILE